MPQAKASQQRIDRSDLDAGASAGIAKQCGLDMVLPVRDDKRERREPIDDLVSGLRAGESLQWLLEDQSGGVDRFSALKCRDQTFDLGLVLRGIAAQRQRPDARVDEQVHRRVRSAL